MFLNLLRKIKRRVFNPKPKKKVLKNYFQKTYTQKALLSYITEPFVKGVQYKHTNHNEVVVIAKILDKLNYQVDIIDFDNNNCTVPYHQYKLIIGCGRPLEQAFYEINLQKTCVVLYGTGIHNFTNNQSSLKRVYENYLKTNALMINSARFVEEMWSLQNNFSDAAIVLGNEYVANSFRAYNTRTPFYPIPASFHQVLNFEDIHRNITEAQKHFLWFGSNGLIHKGLDLLLEVFSQRQDIYLHICGANTWEKDFFEVYQGHFNYPNIFNHGFINIHTVEFKNILEKCAFVIFPSTGEGGCASVVTAMGNGGTIPIITQECGLDVENFGIMIEDLSIPSIKNAIETALKLAPSEIQERMEKTYNFVSKVHSVKEYEMNMERHLKKILNKKNA
ncbi:MAG: glycosyltransferase [Raineya sp.]|jgi:hypothetical protein|nr:glycosyltransferase [Raineya sp.]